MRARILRLSMLMGAALSLSLPLAASESRAAEPAIPPLTWTDCGDGFQCANASVPLDHDEPAGRRIDIALIRLPATDRARRIGSLFLNFGGPGLSGLQFVRTAPPGAFDLFSRFDIVGFDPRGLGASRPAVRDCGEDPSSAMPIPRPRAGGHREFLARANAYVENCRAINAEILPHLSSANVARDLDLLRAAVGDTQLSYIGLSYGSVIGATYASLFPGRTRAMVLDSPIDVQSYYDRPAQQWREHAEGHEHALGRFLAACAASNGNCAFGGEDPAKALEELLVRLDAAPVRSANAKDRRIVTGDVIRRVLEDALRSRRLWPKLALALAQAERGDGTAVLQLFDRIPGDAASNDFQVAVLAVDQNYRRPPVREYFDLAERSLESFRHFWFLSGYWDLVRGLWRVEDRDAFRGRIRNAKESAPILVIGMKHDPATPYVQAQRLTADLGNARLLTFEADGHLAVMSFDPCVMGAIVSYVHEGMLPPEGAVCVQQGEAFPAAGH